MKLYLGQKRKRQVVFGLIGLICNTDLVGAGL